MKKILVIAFSYFTILFHSQVKIDDYKRLLDSAIIINKNHNESDLKNKSCYLITSDNSKYITSHFLLNSYFKSIEVYNKKNQNLLKKGINAWKIIPVMNKNKLIIKIIDLNIYYKNNNYQFINNGGATVIFEYSCKEEKWKLLTERYSGI
ncbi:hypothetical protein SAMN05421664_0739 [Chryseobacterium soldanellicola]|uniref:Uncharacterized protein n=1 Tax=Chryseobacterium soldanellicola TaxID=311333 RepID=A0A1H0YIA8_9FLAO|nr:hypothetical protein [Chryseobacterium soldanellicola]SDQ14818.1 hypothetical protein SAMN05421664_0739 [Chryseobacterium soldanellicola]